MNSIKRVVLILLAILLLSAALTSCAKKENNAPDGMMIASVAGSDYLLYVPTTWNLNTFYGISGAYRDATQQSVISASRYPAATLTATGENRNALFWETVCLPQITSHAVNGEVTPYTEDVDHSAHTFSLGGKTAEYRHVTALVPAGEGKQTTLHFVQAVAERNEFFYVLSFSGTQAIYTLCETDLDKIFTEFEFSDTPYQPAKAAWKPAKVTPPQGMQVASSDEVAYRFFAPQEWEINTDRRIFAAVEPSDRSNVSIIAYMPAESGMSVEQFHQMTVDLITQVSGKDSYRELNSKEGSLGGKPAMDYEFEYTVGEKTYHYRQLVATYRGMFYTMTYTAVPDAYAKHFSQFERMAAELIFR